MNSCPKPLASLRNFMPMETAWKKYSKFLEYPRGFNNKSACTDNLGSKNFEWFEPGTVAQYISLPLTHRIHGTGIFIYIHEDHKTSTIHIHNIQSSHGCYGLEHPLFMVEKNPPNKCPSPSWQKQKMADC